MTELSSPNLTRVTYHRVYTDPQGESHFAVVTVKQRLMQAAPPAAPFYASGDEPAPKHENILFLNNTLLTVKNCKIAVESARFSFIRSYSWLLQRCWDIYKKEIR